MTSFQTFETTGTIDEKGVLQVAPFVGVPSGQVRVSVCVPLVPGPSHSVETDKAKPDAAEGSGDFSTNSP